MIPLLITLTFLHLPPAKAHKCFRAEPIARICVTNACDSRNLELEYTYDNGWFWRERNWITLYRRFEKPCE